MARILLRLTLSLSLTEDRVLGRGLSTAFSCDGVPGSTFVMQSGRPVDSSAIHVHKNGHTDHTKATTKLETRLCVYHVNAVLVEWNQLLKE